MAVLKVKNLLLRCYIGFNPHEIGKKQDVLINIRLEFDSSTEEKTDNPEDALNYKTLSKEIIGRVENSRFNLLESLAKMVLDTVMENKRVLKAEVEIDKLHALRFSESVSITLSDERG